MDSIQQLLEYCRHLAREAAGKGNPAVGAVVVRNGAIIGEGEEGGKSRNDVTCHAEIEAIRDAVRQTGRNDLSDCQLVSTHEPCVMCSYVIRYHQLEKVLYEQPVAAVGGINSQHPVLTDPDFWPSKPVPEVRRIEEIEH